MKKGIIRPVIPHPSDATAALVELTRGYWAVVDAVDAALVGRFNWQVHFDRSGGIRAARTSYVNGRKEKMYLHRLVGEAIGLGGGLVDHRDLNGLDNRRRNLRAATRAQNNQNASRRRDNTSGFKGVSRSHNGKWDAYIGHDGRQTYLGRFLTVEQAASAVTEARNALHGAFARSN